MIAWVLLVPYRIVNTRYCPEVTKPVRKGKKFKDYKISYIHKKVNQQFFSQNVKEPKTLRDTPHVSEDCPQFRRK